LPKNVAKKVNFVPGSFDLGRLTDAESGTTLSSAVSEFRIDEAANGGTCISPSTSTAACSSSSKGIAAKISAKGSSIGDDDDEHEEDDDGHHHNGYSNHHDYDNDSNEFSEAREEIEEKKA
jgi:hypothetical protein